jgi:hypothetical protein
VLAEEAGKLLSVIEARAASGQTGAAWQRLALARHTTTPGSN